jgi:T-complex protein 1 subunit theta
MLKGGSKHLKGIEDAILKNIDACKSLSSITRTSLGPNGMNKLVVDHLKKLLITCDTATIVKNLEIVHPAVKILEMAADAQQQEIGDGINLVIILAGELLGMAGSLIRDGVHPSEIINGYSKAINQALEDMKSLILPGSETFDRMNVDDVIYKIKGTVSTKHSSSEVFLCRLIARACIEVSLNEQYKFSVENIRVAKIIGGGIEDSICVKGLVITRDTEGSIKAIKDSKVVVYTQGIGHFSTETKGTVLMRNADELIKYSNEDENYIKHIIKGIIDAGAKVVICGSSVSEIAYHFLEHYRLMFINVPSKFELQRICRVTGCCTLVKMGPPTVEELGFAKKIDVRELGGSKHIFIEQSSFTCILNTIVLRGATTQVLDDMERAVNTGVNAYRALCKDAKTLPAGGAVEMEIAKRLIHNSRKEIGLEQYAIQKFAEALEVIPRTLAENSGLDASSSISALWSAHASGDKYSGLDICTGKAKDLTKENITDLYSVKWWAFKLLVDAVIMILKVDHIIMAKQAGGPKTKLEIEN